LLQVREARAIGVERALARRGRRERVDEEFGDAARVHLERKLARARGLPQLPR
jgi:hypothetical protein